MRATMQSVSAKSKAYVTTNNSKSIRQPKEDSKGERTKDRILDAALKLFSQTGSNAVSIRAIASEAGISHSGLLRYFADKDDLTIQAIRRRDKTAEMARAMLEQTGEPAYETVIPWIMDTIRHNTQTPGIVATFVKISAEATDIHHPAHQYFQDRYRLFTHKLADSIVELTHVEFDDARSSAQQFIAYMDGIQIQWLLDPTNTDMLAGAVKFLEGLDIPVHEIIEHYSKLENRDEER